MIIQSDTLDYCKTLPDGFFDLSFCSPPYEDARTYGIGFSLKGEEWVKWAVERFIEQYRVTKGATCWVVEGKTKDFRYSATPILMMADLHRAGVHLRNPPIFHRIGVPGSGGPDWLRNDKEFIICASHGRLPWSDNTAMGEPPKWKPGGDMSHRMQSGRRVARTMTKTRADSIEVQGYSPPAVANPGNLIERTYTTSEVVSILGESGDVTSHIVGGGRMGSLLCHENEAPFPESLAEFFVRSFCPPDGKVYDGFCGSGTTPDVAKRLGRQFFGTDIRASQIELTGRRLNEN
jgi:site-specific DNA-methyltransferase (cytosine-N4-specific)